MFPDNIKLSSGSLYLKDEFLTHNPPLVEIPDEPFPDYIRSYNLKNLVDAELEMEAEIDIPMLHRFSTTIDVASILSGAQSMSVVYSEPYQEQRRKHKKKRINKKWAKRYGYVTKFRKWRINEVSLMSNGGLEFEATGRNIELLKG